MEKPLQTATEFSNAVYQWLVRIIRIKAGPGTPLRSFIIPVICLPLLASIAFSQTTVLTYDDIRRTGGDGDNLFIAENEPLPGDVPPEIRVNADSIDLQAQTDGMTNFILYFDLVELEIGDSVRATFDFILLGDLRATINYPLAFGLYHTNPDPDTSADGYLTEDNISSSDQRFIRYEGYGIYLKPSEEAGQEETQVFASRRANQQGSSANNILNQNAQTRFGHHDVAMSLASNQQFSIEVLRTSEDFLNITISLPAEGYQRSFESLSYHPAVTRFDTLALRHGTADETEPSVIRITDVEIVATLANLPDVTYAASVVPGNAGTIDGESEGTVPEGSTLELSTTASGNLVFDRFETSDVIYPDNPAQIEIASTTDITAYYVPAAVAGILSGLVPSEDETRPWDSPWLGEIAVHAFPWVYSESGWLYFPVDEGLPNDDALWVYDYDLGWTFTGGTFAPFFYVHESRAWAFAFPVDYAEGNSGRWVGFFNQEGEIGGDNWMWYPGSAPHQ